MNRRITMHRAAVLISTLLIGAAAAAPAATSAALTPSERIRSQKAIEQVYWSHRSGGGDSSFEQAVPETVLARKAEDAVLKTSALRRFWRVEITPEQLQAELDRMAAHSKSPARLRELFAALGNDPLKAAEGLARPLLADRLLRTYYAHDRLLHEDTRARAEREIGEIGSAPARERTTRVISTVEWRRGLGGHRIPGVLELEQDDFDARVRELRLTMGGATGDIVLDQVSPLREDETRSYAIVVHALDDQQVEVSTIEWPKRSFDEWWSETRGTLAPEPGGTAFEFRLPKVAGANCIDDTWTPTLQLLDPRYWHTAVWTGTKMVVWGGRADTGGGRYDPVTDTWEPTSAAGAPAGRVNASVGWTGTEMLVWGGEGAAGLLNSGGRYNSASDTWTPMATAPLAPRAYHSAVWTGSQMIIWDGYNVHIGQLYGDGARYSPATDSWSPVAAAGAPDARCSHTAVWTGTEMIIWGGANDSSGGRYDPATDSWRPTTLIDAPHVRARWALVHGLDRLRDDHLGGHHRDPAGQPLLRGAGERDLLRRLRERRRLGLVAVRSLRPHGATYSQQPRQGM